MDFDWCPSTESSDSETNSDPDPLLAAALPDGTPDRAYFMGLMAAHSRSSAAHKRKRAAPDPTPPSTSTDLVHTSTSSHHASPTHRSATLGPRTAGASTLVFPPKQHPGTHPTRMARSPLWGFPRVPRNRGPDAILTWYNQNKGSCRRQFFYPARSRFGAAFGYSG